MSKKPTYEELENRVREFEKTESEYKETIKQLKLNEERFRKLYEETPLGYQSLDLEGRFIEANKALLDLMGYSRSEVIGHWFGEFLAPSEVELFKKRFSKFIESGEVHTDVQMLKRDGSEIVVHIDGQTGKDEKGKFKQTHCILHNITERKQAEEELSRVARELQTTFDTTNDAIWILDKDHRVLRSNKTAERIFQRPKEKMIGKRCCEIVHNTAQPIPECPILRAQDSLHRETMELKLGESWVEVLVDPILNANGQYAGAIHIVSDITERKRAEEALRDSRDMMRTVLDSIPSAVFWKDRNSIYLGGNRIWLEAAGLKSLEEVVGKSDYDLPWEEGQADSFREDDRRVMESGIPEYAIIEPYFRADGTHAWAKTNKVPLRDTEGNVTGVLGTYEDITERKQVEEALRKSEAQLSNAMKMVKLGHWELDVDSGMFTFTDSFYAIFRTTAEKEGGYQMSVADYAKRFVHPESSQVVAEETRKALETDDPNFSRYLEHRMLYSDGSVGDIAVRFFIVKDDKGKTIKTYGVNQDITMRKQAEEEKERLKAQLLQSQKMESIGTLAGGIAHDFNNILSPIMLHTEMIRLDLPSDSPLQMGINQIYLAGKRARDLVKQILTFARIKEEDRIPIKTSLVVKEVIEFLRSTIPSTIDIQYDLKTEQDAILADPTQMNQIVMNLCTNASHAMREEGGVLEITLSDEYIGPDEISRSVGLDPGHYLRMSISDTGSGIPPDIIDKIFEPYFTTKGPGEGTGLGLAVIHGIVKNYGGDITVESEVGKGTTFHVLLPIIDVEIFPTKDAKIELHKGRERILLVDDEKWAVDAMQSMLERLGYKVTVRTSSIETLETFRQNPEGFDLVITDMTMPNMTGNELAKELMTIRPDIPIILCTGFSEQIDERRAKAMGISAFVMKPIVMSVMANTIRKILDKK